MLNKYNVTDARTMKIVYAGLTRKEVHKAIGIKLYRIYEYVNDKKLYDNIYYIEVVESEMFDKKFKREWREITEKLLKYKGLERIKIKMKENGE